MAKFNRYVDYESYADWVYDQMPYDGYFAGTYFPHENKPEVVSLHEIKDLFTLYEIKGEL